jgi:hypothetical protein
VTFPYLAVQQRVAADGACARPLNTRSLDGREMQPSMIASWRLRGLVACVVSLQLSSSAVGVEPAPPPSSDASRTSSPALERWPFAIEAGGGITRGGGTTFEATFSPDPGGPHLSTGYSSGDRGSVFYGEVAVNLLATVGLGADHHTDSTTASRWGVHALVGLPVPIVGFGPDGASSALKAPFRVAPILFYCEPFYRPHFRSGAAIDHEMGVVLKLRVGITRRQWSRPGFSLLEGVMF